MVSIRSNTDGLSARAVHASLVEFIRDELIDGEAILKAVVPKREGDLFAHVGHTGPVDMGAIIEGSVGIPEIHKSGESDPLSAKYPVFADKGTGIYGGEGIIFAKRKEFMYIPPERGGGTEYPLFLRASKGQRGQHFSLIAFANMVAMLEINGEKFKAELTSRLDLDKEMH